jgi:hypothetical protein
MPFKTLKTRCLSRTADVPEAISIDRRSRGMIVSYVAAAAVFRRFFLSETI